MKTSCSNISSQSGSEFEDGSRFGNTASEKRGSSHYVREQSTHPDCSRESLRTSHRHFATKSTNDKDVDFDGGLSGCGSSRLSHSKGVEHGLSSQRWEGRKKRRGRYCEGGHQTDCSKEMAESRLETEGSVDVDTALQGFSIDETSMSNSIYSDQEAGSSSELSVDPTVWKKFKFLSSILKETQHNLRAMDDLIFEHRRMQDMTQRPSQVNTPSTSVTCASHPQLDLCEGEAKTDEAKLEEILTLLHSLTNTLTSYERHPLLAMAVTTASDSLQDSSHQYPQSPSHYPQSPSQYPQSSSQYLRSPSQHESQSVKHLLPLPVCAYEALSSSARNEGQAYNWPAAVKRTDDQLNCNIEIHVPAMKETPTTTRFLETSNEGIISSFNRSQFVSDYDRFPSNGDLTYTSVSLLGVDDRLTSATVSAAPLCASTVKDSMERCASVSDVHIMSNTSGQPSNHFGDFHHHKDYSQSSPNIIRDFTASGYSGVQSFHISGNVSSTAADFQHPLTKETRSLRKEIDNIVERKQALDSRLQSLIANRAATQRQGSFESSEGTDVSETNRIRLIRSKSLEEVDDRKFRSRIKKYKNRSKSQEEENHEVRGGTSARESYISMLTDNHSDFPSLVMGSLDHDDKITELKSDEADLPGLGDSGLSSEINSISATIQELIRENQQLHNFIQGITFESIAKVDKEKLDLEAKIETLNEENKSLISDVTDSAEDHHKAALNKNVQEKAVKFLLSQDDIGKTEVTGISGESSTIMTTKPSTSVQNLIISASDRLTIPVHREMEPNQTQAFVDKIKALEAKVDQLSLQNESKAESREEHKPLTYSSWEDNENLKQKDIMVIDSNQDKVRTSVGHQISDFPFTDYSKSRSDPQGTSKQTNLSVLLEEEEYTDEEKIRSSQLGLESSDPDSTLGIRTTCSDRSDFEYHDTAREVGKLKRKIDKLVEERDELNFKLNKEISERDFESSRLEAKVRILSEQTQSLNRRLKEAMQESHESKEETSKLQTSDPVEDTIANLNTDSSDHHSAMIDDSEVMEDGIGKQSLVTTCHDKYDIPPGNTDRKISSSPDQVQTELMSDDSSSSKERTSSMNRKLSARLEELLKYNEALMHSLKDLKASTASSAEVNLESTISKVMEEHCKLMLQTIDDRLTTARLSDMEIRIGENQEFGGEYQVLQEKRNEVLLNANDSLVKPLPGKASDMENVNLDKKQQSEEESTPDLASKVVSAFDKILVTKLKDNKEYESSLEGKRKLVSQSSDTHLDATKFSGKDITLEDLNIASKVSTAFINNRIDKSSQTEIVSSKYQEKFVKETYEYEHANPDTLSKYEDKSNDDINIAVSREKEKWSKLLEQAEEEKDGLRDRIKTLVEENDCLAARLEEMMGVTRNLSDQMHSTKEQLFKVATEKDDLEKKVRSLEEGKEDSSLSISDSATSSRLTQRLRERIRSLQGECEGAWQEVHERTKERDKVMAEKESSEYVNNISLNTAKSEVETLRNQISMLEDEMAKKSTALTTASNALEKKSLDLRTLQMDKTDIHEKALETEKKVENMKEALKVCQDKLDNEAAERKKLEAQLEDAQQKNNSSSVSLGADCLTEPANPRSDRHWIETITRLKGQLHQEQLRSRLLEVADQESSTRILVLQKSIRDTIEAHENLQAKYRQLRAAYRAKKTDNMHRRELSQQFSAHVQELGKSSAALEENLKMMLSSLGENIDITVEIFTSHVFLSPCVVHPSPDMRTDPEAWFAAQMGRLRWLQTQLRKLCLHSWKTADLPRTSNISFITTEGTVGDRWSFQSNVEAQDPTERKTRKPSDHKQESSPICTPKRTFKTKNLSELSILDESRSRTSTPVKKKLGIPGISLAGVCVTSTKDSSTSISQEESSDISAKFMPASVQETLVNPSCIIDVQLSGSSKSFADAEQMLMNQQRQLSQDRFDHYRALVASLHRDLEHPLDLSPSSPSSVLTTPEKKPSVVDTDVFEEDKSSTSLEVASAPEVSQSPSQNSTSSCGRDSSSNSNRLIAPKQNLFQDPETTEFSDQDQNISRVSSVPSSHQRDDGGYHVIISSSSAEKGSSRSSIKESRFFKDLDSDKDRDSWESEKEDVIRTFVESELMNEKKIGESSRF